jgi:hypothetical protein
MWKLGNEGNKNNDLNFAHQMLMKIYSIKKKICQLNFFHDKSLIILLQMKNGN